MPSPYDVFHDLKDRLARLPVEPADALDPLAGLEEPSAYVTALARCFLLAPEGALEEDNLRALFLQYVRAEGIDGEALLSTVSEDLRREGALP